MSTSRLVWRTVGAVVTVLALLLAISVLGLVCNGGDAYASSVDDAPEESLSSELDHAAYTVSEPRMMEEASTNEDSVAPTLNEFRVIDTSVTRPGVVQIQLDITEEDSGFSDFGLSLSWNKNGIPQNGGICTGLEFGGASGDMCSNFQLSIDQNGAQFGEYSGAYIFNLYIGKGANISDYAITQLWVRDKYGNTNTYEDEALGSIASDGNTGFSITGDNSGDDFIPPVLNSFRIVNPSVSRPGILQIQLDVFEEGAGFSDFDLSLSWNKNGTPQNGSICTGLEFGGASGDMCSNFELSIDQGGKQFGENSGTYTFELYIGEKANIADYAITGLWIRDKAGNETSYSTGDLPILAVNGASSFSVTGDSSSDDVVAPALNSFEILNPTVNRPGVLKLKIDIAEEESGLSDIDISLSWEKDGVRRSGSISTGLEFGGASGDMCSNFEFESNNWKNFGGKTGSYVFTLLIGEKADLSTYSIDRIWLRDKYGNEAEVGTTDPEGENDIINYSSNGISSFVLNDEFSYSFATGTNNSSLAKKLRTMPVGTAAKVEIVGDKVLKKECLDAIKGQDKTIVAYSSGIQWIIHGNQLTGTTKDINLGVKVSSIKRGDYFADSGNSDSDWALSDDAMKLEFYNNGVLPGRMQVRFKSDALYDKGIGGSAPSLYYFNGEKLILENSDSDLNFDGTDKWCYVNISHNSTFAVSNSSALRLKEKLRAPCNVKSLWASRHDVGKVLFKWTKESSFKPSGWQVKYRTKKIGKGNWSGWSTKSLGASTYQYWCKVPKNYVVEVHARAKGDKSWSQGIITTPAGGRYQAMKTVYVKNASTNKRVDSITIKKGQSVKLKPDYVYPVANYKKRPRLYPTQALWDLSSSGKSLVTIYKPNGSKYTGGMIDGAATIRGVKAGTTNLICRAPNGRTKVIKVTVTK